MGKSKRDLDEILSDYVDILNSQGPDSAQERAYLKRYAKDAEASAILQGARALKALFDSLGQPPPPDDVADRKISSKPGPSLKPKRRIR